MPPKSQIIDDIHDFLINVKTRTIYVHSETEVDGDESGVGYRMASSFIKNLDYLNSISDAEITVKFITCGGCWNYGMAMFDAIKQSPSIITSISYAHSSSMSSIIPQAADKRLISRHCDFMVHYGDYSDGGDLRKVVHGIKHHEKAKNIMLDLYADKCCRGAFAKENKLTDAPKMAKFIEGKIDKLTDWWLTAEEAVYYGFMDGVLGE